MPEPQVFRRACDGTMARAFNRYTRARLRSPGLLALMLAVGLSWGFLWEVSRLSTSTSFAPTTSDVEHFFAVTALACVAFTALALVLATVFNRRFVQRHFADGDVIEVELTQHHLVFRRAAGTSRVP